MRFSLLTFMTFITLAAWGVAVWQSPHELHVLIVIASAILLTTIVVGVALASPTNSAGGLDLENNVLFNVLEPAFRIMLVSLLIGCVLFMIFIVAFFLYLSL